MTEFENFFYRDDVIYEDFFTLRPSNYMCWDREADFDNINLVTNIDGTKN